MRDLYDIRLFIYRGTDIMETTGRTITLMGTALTEYWEG